MPSIDDVYSGSSLAARDLKGKKVNLTISDVDIKEFEDNKGKRIKKLVLSFKNTDKVFVVNKTNAGRISESHGPDFEEWVGKKISLVTERVPFGPDIVDAIRVVLPEKGEYDDEVEI